MARRPKLPKQQMRAMKRLWVDPKRETFYDVPQRNGTRDIRIPLQLDALLEAWDELGGDKTGKQGRPFECFVNFQIQWHAFAHPEQYSHPVIIPYVEQGGGVWLISHKKGAVPIRCYRYRNNLAKYVREFDKIRTREQMVEFIQRLKKRNVTLILRRPGKARLTAKAAAAAAIEAAGGSSAEMRAALERHPPGPRKVEFIAGKRRYSRGARSRFEAAGLLLPRYNGTPAPAGK